MLEERDSVEATVFTQWTVVLGRNPESFEADFFVSGGTSFDAAMLMSRLGKAFGFAPAMQVIFDHRSVRSLANWIREQPGTRATRVLPLNPGTGVRRPPLLFVPGVNGDLILLHRFGDTEFGRPIWGVESRGFAADDGGPVRTMDGIAVDLADQIEARLPRQAVHVGGFSSGAMVSLELARELNARGWPLVSLVMIGPDEPPPSPPQVDYDALVASRLRKMAGLDQSDEVVPPQALFAAIRTNRPQLAEDTAQELIRRAHVWASNYCAVIGHVPASPPPLRSLVVLDAAQAPGEPFWKDFFDTGVCEVHTFEIDHFSMIYGEPVIRFVAGWLHEADKNS